MLLSLSKRRPHSKSASTHTPSPLAHSFVKRKLSLRKRGHTIHHISDNSSAASNQSLRPNAIDPLTISLPLSQSHVVTQIHDQRRPDLKSRRSPDNPKVCERLPPKSTLQENVANNANTTTSVRVAGADTTKPLPPSPLHYQKSRALTDPLPRVLIHHQKSKSPTHPLPTGHFPADPEFPVRIEQLRDRYKIKKKVTFALPDQQPLASVTATPSATPSSTLDILETPSTMSTTSFPDLELDPIHEQTDESPIDISSPNCDPDSTGIIRIGYAPEGTQSPEPAYQHSQSLLQHSPVMQSSVFGQVSSSPPQHTQEILQPSVFEQTSSLRQQQQSFSPSHFAETPYSTLPLHTAILPLNINKNSAEHKITHKMEQGPAQTKTSQKVKTQSASNTQGEGMYEMGDGSTLTKTPPKPKTPDAADIQGDLMLDIMGILYQTPPKPPTPEQESKTKTKTKTKTKLTHQPEKDTKMAAKSSSSNSTPPPPLPPTIVPTEEEEEEEEEETSLLLRLADSARQLETAQEELWNEIRAFGTWRRHEEERDARIERWSEDVEAEVELPLVLEEGEEEEEEG